MTVPAVSLVARIVSGGQTGADRGALDAAIDLGIAQGGFCPRGRLAEDGLIPPHYALEETGSAEYAERTRLNVELGDATIAFTWGEPSGGTAFTIRCAEEADKPLLVVDLRASPDVLACRAVDGFLRGARPRTLNVAGPRESGAPGIGARVRRVLHDVLSPERPTSAGDARSPLRPDDLPLLDLLASRPPSETTPLLLELSRVQAARRRPGDLMAQIERDGFVRPAVIDLRTANALDLLALQAAAEFEPVLLSPLAPLGVCAAVSPSSQNRVVTTTRGSEVVSDPTNVLAIQCALRLRKGAEVVRLCTVHQTVRAQRFAAGRGYAQHFRLFACVEAGPARADHAFEVDAFIRHVAVFQRLVDSLEARGSRFPNPTLRVLVAEKGRGVGARVRARLVTEAPRFSLEEGPLESNYYDGVRVLFDADDVDGRRANLSDIGLFDWVARLTANRRHRFVASGFGLQLVPSRFTKPAS